ncbi:MAG: ATP synthase subunit delta [Candidatus Sericytochromatia bacterium]|nr:MAG: ATP synthase subunit delta [Candidatus Sericytochromatia bacterium]
MKNTVVSSRYTEALFNIAKEKNFVTKIQSDLKLISDTFLDNADLNKFFFNPIVSIDDKKEIIEKLFKNNIDSVTFSFINLLLDKKREGNIFEIKEIFDKMVNNLFSKVIAEVYTAIDIDNNKEIINQLKNKLSSYLDKEVEIKTFVDENILGGVLVKIGDRIIDGTIRTQLENISKILN